MKYGSKPEWNYPPFTKTMKIKALFAVRKGDPDWAEQLITEVESRIESAKQWATGQGFDRFRVVEIDDSVAPDFAATIQKP